MEFHDKDKPLETRLVQVRGLVQGIGYREACVRRATALGVTGWVRNRMDGSGDASGLAEATDRNVHLA